ncbi:MAG: PSD1 and planctomycete cytochrome C domain-containing protein [Planctomycetota bacterium]
MLFASSPAPYVRRGAFVVPTILTLFATSVAWGDSSSTGVHFSRDIRPILADKCFACHGPGEATAGVRLDTLDGATDWAIVPGDADSSEVIARITSDDPDVVMPPPEAKKDPLTDEEVALLREWIDSGAEYQAHWSYRPLERPSPPAVEDATNAAWKESAVDRFVLARIKQAGVTPSPEADPVTLVRRLYLDVTGLPPSPEEVDAYLADTAADRYEKLVDKLLASPEYAERMAQWWFDLTRFANTVGYHGDQPHRITPYRDWVLDALNNNKPFDEFTTEQLAGDLMPDTGNASADLWRLVATGYNRVLQTSHEGGIQDKEYRAKMLADRVRNVSEVWLGTSMGCAECHDHKFDPVTQKDFYQMAAFFADVDRHGSFQSISTNTEPTARPPEVFAPTLPMLKRLAEIDKDLKSWEERRDWRVDARHAKHREEVLKLKRERLELESKFVPTMVTEAVKPRPIRVLDRGNWMDDSGEIVGPAAPEFLVSANAASDRLTRLDLARWIVSDENPLTARVAVNRLWNLYFGRGFSRELIDVGSQSEWPTHPELLDWLAVEFRESGWDLKHMVKVMVTSRAYRQSSATRPELAGDPENKLIARQGRYRVAAEQVRDIALVASGLLRRQLGGVIGKPYQPAGYYAQLNYPERKYKPASGADQHRRGVYTHWQRQFLHPWLVAFDAPTREECTANRPLSNTPSAALVLLNDPSFVESARGLATRVLVESKLDADEPRLRWAWRQATSREPRSEEVAVLEELLAARRERFRGDPAAAEALIAIGQSPQPEGVAAEELAAWTSVSRALLNLSETITRN